jgi:ADP-heptose:LPS heptosyltransferase
MDSRKALERVARGARVLIVRLRSLGDCVLTTPAIALLHGARPDLRIGVVVEPRFAEVFAGNPAVERILGPSYAEVLAYRASLTLNLHGGTRSMLLTAASLARWRAGFAHHKGAALVYNEPIPRAQEVLGEERTVHTAEHLASAMFYLGVPACEIPRARLYAPLPAAREPYAVIHPASAAAYKTWSAAGFVEVAEHIRRTRGLEPVFIGAGGDDLTPFAAYRTVQGAPLREAMSLIGGARLFVGNDSGPAHIAAAYGVPLVVLYGREEHRVIWAPWRAEWASTLCAAEGIHTLEVEEVLAAVDGMG